MEDKFKKLEMFIGPAGNSQSFYDEGLKSTVQAAKWVKEQGLNAFEYPAGRGIRLKKETALEIASAMKKEEVKISLHAPYFINLALDDDDDRVEKNMNYFRESAELARLLGAERIVFHPGSTSKMSREKALALAVKLFKRIIDELDSLGYYDLILCPETMGKVGQLGDLDEVLALCNVDDRVLPTIDFGHLHARSLGNIKNIQDYRKILDTIEDEIGYERAKIMHVHFSKIEFTSKGEKKHRTFDESEYGPEFMPLAEEFVVRDYKPNIICESNGTQAQDAVYIKNCILKNINDLWEEK